MKVIIPPIYESSMDKSNPFKVDSFGRHEFAINLTNLFSNTNDGLVITIDSNWGDGKTTFIKLWEQELRNKNNFIPIYYDAFKNDFSSDAFLSIATLIHEQLKTHLINSGKSPDINDKLDFLNKQSKLLAKELIVMSGSDILSAMTANSISNKWFQKLINTIFGVFEIGIDEKYKAHINSQNTIKEYQAMLEQILSSQENEETNKIVFFVDELDRCRPDFAVEIIEKIKHLFNIPNVFFVLAINREQLVSTIASVYGVEPKDSDIYLQKFVHIETSLPPMTGFSNENNTLINISQHLESLYDDLNFNEFFEKSAINFDKISELISPELINLNPRGIERMMSLIAVGMGSSIAPDEKEVIENHEIDDDAYLNSPQDEKVKIIFVMAALKIGNPEYYEACKNGNFRNEDNGLFIWLENYFVDELEENIKRSSGTGNSFQLDGIATICNILDIYRFPEKETPNKGYSEDFREPERRKKKAKKKPNPKKKSAKKKAAKKKAKKKAPRTKK